MCVTDVPLEAEDHSLTGTGARQHFQDDAMSVALDDLSLALSGDGRGVFTGNGSQTMQTVQEAVEEEEEDASPHNNGDDKAGGDPQPFPAPHSRDLTMQPASAPSGCCCCS